MVSDAWCLFCNSYLNIHSGFFFTHRPAFTFVDFVYLCKRDFSSCFSFFSACSHACHEANRPAWAACRSSCAVCASKGCRQACFERLLQVCPAQPSEILLFNYLHSATQQAVHACVFWTLQEVESQRWLSNNLSPQSGRPRKLILGWEVMRMNCSVVAPQEVVRLRSSEGLFFFLSQILSAEVVW